jgi:hypothetical protein
LPSSGTGTSTETIIELVPDDMTVSALSVDVTGVEDKSLLMFDAARSTWVTTRNIENHFINGGQY